MADADKPDLDDFFAKRDKKKKSSKNKMLSTTEELAKILGKKAEERKKLEEGKSQYVSEDPNNVNVPTNEDDEWLDHEEKKPDYSGLKIQELVLDDEDEAEVQEGKEPGDTVSNDGPWRKRNAKAENIEISNNSTPSGPIIVDEQSIAPPTAPDAADESTPVVPEVESTPIAAAPAGGKYLPPSLRRAQEAASSGGGGGSGSNFPPPSSRPSEASGDAPVKGAYVPPGRRAGSSSVTSSIGVSKPRKPTTAPNIDDESYFPSLGGS